MQKVHALKINGRFAAVAPPLKDNERAILTESILENGCFSPLIVWNGVIVDGHQRYSICREYGIPFDIEEMDFESENEALVWIIKNNLGRRNLTKFQKVEMVLPFEKELKAEAKKRQMRGVRLYENGNVRHMDTRDALAEMAGVSHGVIDQVKYILEHGDFETLQAVRNGGITVYKAYCRTIEKNRPRVVDAVEDTRSSRNEDFFKVQVEYAQVPSVFTAQSTLEKIDCTIKDLLKSVCDGDASHKMIIERLTKVSEMIDNEMRR